MSNILTRRAALACGVAAIAATGPATAAVAASSHPDVADSFRRALPVIDRPGSEFAQDKKAAIALGIRKN